jgi:hypothetical protein
MRFRKHSEIYLFYLIATTLVLFSSFPTLFRIRLSSGNPDYTYYGVVPSRIYSYNLTDSGNLTSGWRLDVGSVGNASLLVISATEDGTHVDVTDMSDGSLLSTGDLDELEKQYVLLANGTMFRVVSNKQVSVMLLKYNSIPATTAIECTLPFGFYTSTDGMYVGKKFVIMGSGQGISDSDYMILAVESARVMITKDDGTQFAYTLAANSYKRVVLSPYRVYTIESTGNIMLQSGYVQGKGGDYVPCFPVPSATGGFVGTYFLTMSLKSQEWGWDPMRNYGFRITASEDALVKVYDLETKMEITELEVKAGSGGRVQPEAYAIAVQSDKPITLSLIHNGTIEQSSRTGTARYASYGHGVLFIGIQPDEDTMVHIPTEAQIDAYFFTNMETHLTIDGEVFTVHANQAFPYIVPGTHTVRSDENVVLQINFWPLVPSYQGLEYTGAIIPCVETVGDNPEVTLVPIGEGFPMMYVFVGVAVAAVAVVVGFLVMKKRGGKA